MNCRFHPISGQREVPPDKAETKKMPAFDAHRECRKSGGRAASWLVAVLGTVVHTCDRLRENVPRMSELAKISLAAG